MGHELALITLLAMGGLPAEATPRQFTGSALLVGGAILVGGGLVWLLVREIGNTRRQRHDVAVEDGGVEAGGHMGLALLGVIVAAGGALRLGYLAVKTLTHTEALVPNIPWPSVSFPPARFSFYDTFWWHFHSEGHPQAYAFLMWAWTKAWGTDLLALRMPSVLFGIGSIILAYMVGRLSYDRRVGLLSAALLAVNGLHIYWSQYARMYAMACFLALLSTLLLLHVVRHSDRRLVWEAAYVGVSWLAAYTQTFFWPVLVTHALWVLLQHDGGLVRRVLTLQALVAALGASSLAHTVYLGDDVTLPGPSWSFIREYLSFGFLFEPDLFSIPARYAPPLVEALTLLLALGSVAAALRVRPRQLRVVTPLSPIRLRHVLPVALGSVLIIGAFAFLAHRRGAIVAAFGIVPILALITPVVGSRLHGVIASRLKRSEGLVVPLPLLLAFVPAAIVLGLSFWTSMLAPRAFLMFVPYLLVVLAAGFIELARGRRFAIPLWVVLVAAHLTSVLHFRAYPSEQIDYAGLGQQVSSVMEDGDLVFVLPELWVYTPIYYYLDEDRASYVAEDYAEAAARHPRVWLLFLDSVHWGPYGTTSQEMEAALEGFRVEEEVVVRRGAARLYVRAEPTSSRSPATD